MADSKISALPAAAAALAAMELPVNDAGGNKKITVGQLRTLINGSSTIERTAVALSSDAAANATTTGVEITGLNTTLGAGTYHFEFWIRHVSASTSTGVKFGVNHTGTSTLQAVARLLTTGTTAVSATQTNASTTTPVIMGGVSTVTKSTTAPNLGPWTDVNATTDQLTIIEGILVVTVSGDLELWHASEVAASSTVKAGTALFVTKVA